MTTYSDKHRQYYVANRERILSLRKQREQVWLATPQGKFSTQKRKAKSRGIPWELSFDQWKNIWGASGKWDQRGVGIGNYCMCRNGDVGAYSVENVYIDLITENSKLNYTLCGTNPDGTYRSKVINENFCNQ